MIYLFQKQLDSTWRDQAIPNESYDIDDIITSLINLQESGNYRIVTDVALYEFQIKKVPHYEATIQTKRILTSTREGPDSCGLDSLESDG